MRMKIHLKIRKIKKHGIWYNQHGPLLDFTTKQTILMNFVDF